MKKHNEGYTLPLVMVVLLVLAIVAVTIMTTSMNNMLRQQKFIETMENQYAAQGEIEKIVAQLENLKNLENTETTIPLENVEHITGSKIISGTLAESGGEGDNMVTIECKIEISVDSVEVVDSEQKKFKISGTPKVIYTSYEIIKGGAAE